MRFIPFTWSVQTKKKENIWITIKFQVNNSVGVIERWLVAVFFPSLICESYFAHKRWNDLLSACICVYMCDEEIKSDRNERSNASFHCLYLWIKWKCFWDVDSFMLAYIMQLRYLFFHSFSFALILSVRRMCVMFVHSKPHMSLIFFFHRNLPNSSFRLYPCPCPFQFFSSIYLSIYITKLSIVIFDFYSWVICKYIKDLTKYKQ